MNYFTRHGIAVGDVNGDLLDDVYVCQPGGLPNRLFVQQADGTVVEESATWGVDFLDRTSSALLVDLDNDGGQDLVLATVEGVVVMRNTNGHFDQRALHVMPDFDLQSLSAVDYDNDGDLDVYVTVDGARVHSRRREGLPPFVYHNANEGGENRLLSNEIDGSTWQFRNVTGIVGLSQNNHRHSLAAAWEDCDNDGDQDLYVANDYGQNSLYICENGTFTDEAVSRNVVDFGSGMSVSWGDFNRDGIADLYVGNMFSAAGSRITAQAQFLEDANDKERELYRRFAKGNSLFHGRLDGSYQEVGDSAGVEMGRWAWSSLFVDVNNDGWDDLFVANGYITTDDTGDL